MAATDLERLVVTLTADIKKYESALRRANGVTNKQFNSIEKRAQSLDSRLSKISKNAANNFIAPLAGIGAALAVRSIQNYADEWTTAGNKISAAGQVAGRAGRSLEEINVIANDTRSGLTETVDLYAKLLRSTKDVAESEKDVARATEIVNKAFKAGGAALSEQTAGILQLSQGLGSGILQGDELRSVRENAPLLAQAIADEFETTVSGLKKLGAEGELTTDRIFRAILNGRGKIESAFNATNQTISDGVTRVNNAFLQYIGQSDDSLSATERLVVGLNALADNFSQTADVVLKVAGIIAGALVGRAITGMIVSLGLGTAALFRFVTALRAASSAGALGAALGGVSAAAGPVGLVVGGAVVAALTLFASSSAEASKGAKTYADALDEIKVSADKTADAVDKASGTINSKLVNSLTAGVDEGVAKVDEARAAVVDLFTQIIDNAPRRLVSEEQLSSLGDLRDGLDDGKITAEAAEQALFALANSNPKFQKLADQLSPLLTALGQAIAATDLLQQKLGAAGGSEASVSAYKQYGRTRTEGDKLLEIGKAYSKEIERQNTLTKDQLAVEQEIARIRKDLAASGGFLNDADIASLAQSNIAASASRSAEGKKPKKEKVSDFEREVEQIKERTAALQAETAALRERDPLIEDYGYTLERASVAQGLLAAAQKTGLAVGKEVSSVQQLLNGDFSNLTPKAREQAEAMLTLSEAQAQATVESEKLAEKQKKLVDAVADFKETSKSMLSGFISDLRQGKSATEALEGALNKVLDKVIEIAINSAFDGKSGGFFEQIGRFFGLGGGGGQLKIASSGGVGLYDKGGYTGSGGRLDPAGIVHKGEYVFDQDSVKAAGGPGALDALRGRLKGYANGGAVGSAPRLPAMGRVAANNNNEPIRIVVGVTKDGELQAYVQNESAKVSAKVVQVSTPGIIEKSTTAVGGAIGAGRYDSSMANYGVSRQAKVR